MTEPNATSLRNGLPAQEPTKPALSLVTPPPEHTELLLPRVWRATDLDPSKPVEWLAEDRIPRGNVTVLVGDEGIGKSLLWVWIVTAITTGKGVAEYGIPKGAPRPVLLFLAENGWSDMDRPRLEVAGANLDYVHLIATHQDGTGAGVFSQHTQQLIDDMDEKPVLIVADPWLDTVPGNLNVKDGQQAKQAIRPWREIAVKHNAGVLLVAHTNRMASASARDKYGATAELRKTARMTLYAQVDDETEFLTVGPEKSNLVPSGMKAESFRINARKPQGFPKPVPYLEYVGQSRYTAGELIEEKYATAQESGKPETVDAKQVIFDFLRKHNGTAPANLVKDHWESMGISRPSWRTITNNRRKWGIETYQTGDGWEWFLPESDHD